MVIVAVLVLFYIYIPRIRLYIITNKKNLLFWYMIFIPAVNLDDILFNWCNNLQIECSRNVNKYYFFLEIHERGLNKENHRKYNNTYRKSEKGLKGYYLCKRIIIKQICVGYHGNTVNAVIILLLLSLLLRSGSGGGGVTGF